MTTRSREQIHLGSDLILRWSTKDDEEKIALAVGRGFAPRQNTPNLFMARTVSRLMRGDCPAMTPNDFCLIEDHSVEGVPIVACCCLQRYQWSYDGIPLVVGRPEVVTTIPQYRHRGLTRTLFAAVHHRSEQEGHLLQAIVGIPYFYRRLGYEYALDLGGKCILPIAPPPQSTERQLLYFLREATLEDIPFLQHCYDTKRTSLVRSSITEAIWRYYIDGWKAHPDYDHIRSVQIITNQAGSAQGFLLTTPRRWWKRMEIYALELTEQASWFNVLPSLLQTLIDYGQHMPIEREDTLPLTELVFTLGRTHPTYEVLGAEGYAIIWQPPDGWYIRIPDVPKFLTHISPALQRRLDTSILRGYTGDLKLDTYTGGVRLLLEQGRFLAAESWERDPYVNDADAHMPPNLLWQLILGYRSIDELHAIPDVLVDRKEQVVLNTLFPARSSFVLPLEFK
jgi:hypothetical protein